HRTLPRARLRSPMTARLPPPYNPYAAPHAQVIVRHADGDAPGEFVKWMYAGAVGLSVVAWSVHYAGPSLTESRVEIPLIASALLVPLAAAKCALAGAWLYCAWKGVPEVQRGTISPWRAALSLAIPVYNLYWIFAINTVLCDTLNGILERAREPVRAPR